MRLLLCCLIIITWTAAARAACSVRSRATVALTVTGGPILVPLAVNGTTATFILDTGAERSLVTQAAVTRLGLTLDEWVGTTMHGVGGIERHRNADPRSLTLGGVVLQRHTLNHDTSLAVGNMPRTEAGGRTVDGLLGRDFLSVFDLAIDMPAQTLTLYDVAGCSGRFLPWPGAYSAVPVQNPMESALVAQVTLDGMPMRALIDTGASSSVVGAPGMVRLGADGNDAATPVRVLAGGRGTGAGTGAVGGADPFHAGLGHAAGGGLAGGKGCMDFLCQPAGVRCCTVGEFPVTVTRRYASRTRVTSVPAIPFDQDRLRRGREHWTLHGRSPLNHRRATQGRRTRPPR
jgi:hypothetical protein